MQSFEILEAIAAPLPWPNLDTDQIVPKQFLVTRERTGLARALFFEHRFDPAGAPRPDFVLNRAEFRDCGILIAGPNFGCGSSREHAAWALLEFGISCVIAPSFGEIFAQNCFNNGLLPVTLAPQDVDRLAADARGGTFTVDLPSQTIAAPAGFLIGFDLDAARKRKLLDGLDDVDRTLRHLPAIATYEAAWG